MCIYIYIYVYVCAFVVEVVRRFAEIYFRVETHNQENLQHVALSNFNFEAIARNSLQASALKHKSATSAISTNISITIISTSNNIHDNNTHNNDNTTNMNNTTNDIATTNLQ